jgi:hypothetical protein
MIYQWVMSREGEDTEARSLNGNAKYNKSDATDEDLTGSAAF